VDELQHWQQRYHHRRPSEPTIFAGVIGIGCMIGLRKMMRISHPINEAELEHTVNWWGGPASALSKKRNISLGSKQ
jgi:Tn3 transposase DDE domain